MLKNVKNKIYKIQKTIRYLSAQNTLILLMFLQCQFQTMALLKKKNIFIIFFYLNLLSNFFSEN